jgi:RNA polymerase sigma-70 factor (ECF subfamily)
LQSVSEKHRTVFVLRFRQELSLKEISEICQCSEGTVKSRLFYALKKIAPALNIFDPNENYQYEKASEN